MDTTEFNETLPTLPKAERKAFQEWFVRFQDHTTWDKFKSQGYRHVFEVVKAVQAHVSKETGRPEQLYLAFMPTELARTSPFFPMSRKEMKDRPTYKDVVLENRWGRITITGPKLSIHDETVLLALLVLAKKHKNNHFQTTYSKLCRTMKVTRGPNTYKGIKASLKRLAGAVVDTELYETKGKIKKVTRSITGVMVPVVDQNEITAKVEIEISKYFLALYGANLSTALDVDKRAALKGDVAKALYRFLQTHKPSPVPFGLLTLCKGINLNTDQPMKEIRKKVRAALTELCKQGHVKRGWKVDRSDNVHIPR